MFEDGAEVALAAADHLAATAAEVLARSATFRLAVSGGHTPWAMFAALAAREVPWDRVVVYQVDERVAAAGDPDRNLTHLLAALGGSPATVVPMPVEDDDLQAAAARYARGAAGAVRPGAPGAGARRPHGLPRTRRQRAGGRRPPRWPAPAGSTRAAGA